METMTNLNRRKTWTNKSVITNKKSNLNENRKSITNEIVEFLERDDNSRMLPEKANAIKDGNDNTQKRETIENPIIEQKESVGTNLESVDVLIG